MALNAQTTHSIAETVKQKITRFQRGRVFSADHIHVEGSRQAVQRSLSRLAEEGQICRIQNGIYYKPEYSPILKGKRLPPDLNETIKVIAKKNNETIQVHGAIAANKLGLSTQVPLTKVFYTNGISREIEIAGSRVKFIHTANRKLLQHAGTDVGMAIAALYYLGKDLVNAQVIQHIQSRLTEKEFEQLTKAELTHWMKSALKGVRAHG
ncbi:DUF6088 family protein [Acinetobacter sp. CAAS 2-6]|uniref:DUF6088 family protein n=1 Tax=Acinetobacter sp. CAAS 2-6 TaxID=3016358 RepID=UPI002DD66AF2|nr:DUF6088 family protein [Acinetobacter sp. CAAS 2-6]